ncbi:MAG: hypothetical protein R2830_01950 [Saprospiraceae bacterium]
MKIANPLYDHAFKYLMSNDRLARKVLSVILEKEVLKLELAQQEVVIEDEERRFTLYRLDFKALIRDENGRQETVLIELQKSKLPTNALRFRSYLGLSYAQKPKPHAGVTDGKGAPLPIISIYILGYNVEDIPVLATKVNRRIIDMSSHEELHIESDFINLLTHTCYILQVRRLPQQRLSRIERFMTLFNQAWVAEENFILDLEEVPEEFKDIAEYLQRPLAEEGLQRKLRAEEEVEELFAVQEAEKEQLRSMAEAERKSKEDERRQKEAAQKREEEERRQKEAAQKREEDERRQKELALEKARENARKLARLLLKTGAPVEDIARETGLPEEEIRSLG